LYLFLISASPNFCVFLIFMSLPNFCVSSRFLCIFLIFVLLPNFCVVLYIICFVSFCVLFVCICVLYYHHLVATQLQSINISYYSNSTKTLTFSVRTVLATLDYVYNLSTSDVSALSESFRVGAGFELELPAYSAIISRICLLHCKRREAQN
jgi:hypothetical protein